MHVFTNSKIDSSDHYRLLRDSSSIKKSKSFLERSRVSCVSCTDSKSLTHRNNSEEDRILTLKAYDVYLKKNMLWVKTIHYPNKIRFHLVAIVPMGTFTPKSISKLRSALHFRYSMVIPRFILRANPAQS